MFLSVSFSQTFTKLLNCEGFYKQIPVLGLNMSEVMIGCWLQKGHQVKMVRFVFVCCCVGLTALENKVWASEWAGGAEVMNDTQSGTTSTSRTGRALWRSIPILGFRIPTARREGCISEAWGEVLGIKQSDSGRVCVSLHWPEWNYKKSATCERTWWSCHLTHVR